MELVKHLKELKNRLIKFEKEKTNEEFDKWLIKEFIKKDIPEFYYDLIGELMTELEGIQVELIDEGKEDDIKKVKYSQEFTKEIFKKIGLKIKELKD